MYIHIFRLVNDYHISPGTLALEISSLVISDSGGSAPFGRRQVVVICVGAVTERLLQLADSFQVGVMQSLHFSFQRFVDAAYILQMALAYLQVFPQLLIHLCNLIVFRYYEVDLSACLLELTLSAACLLPLEFNLLTKRSPFLFFARKQLHLFPDFIFKLLAFQLFAGDMEL